MKVDTDMTMTYEYISPEEAIDFLETNFENRNLSKGTVEAYAQDILSNNWDEETGESISIDKKGILRNGQHRLAAIVMTGKGIKTWVCRNVSSDGIYDNNRKRSKADQVSIIRPDFDKVYRSSRYIAIARVIIGQSTGRYMKTITPKEIIKFTEKHKEDLDGFFSVIPQTTVPKISLAVVHLALYMAYIAGVKIEEIMDFYEILCTGMSTKQEAFPIIAYRNYLQNTGNNLHATLDELGRCQWALKKYLSGSCIKKSMVPKELIYPWPYKMEDI